MLFQLLLKIIAFLIKCFLWFAIVLGGIPMVIYILLLKSFPFFTHEASISFWIVFFILSIIAFLALWRPIMWLVEVLKLLGTGDE